MTLEQAKAEFRAATKAYAAAKHGASNQRLAAKHGMTNTLAFAEMVEYTARHAWLRAHENVVKLQPAAPTASASTPVPTVRKPVAVSAKAAPTHWANGFAKRAVSLDLVGHLNDQCERSEARMWAMYGL